MSRTIIGKALLVILVVAGLLVAKEDKANVLFRNNVSLMAITPGAADTTKWVYCQNWRYQSLHWKQYLVPDAADSVRIKWDYQTAEDTAFPDDGWDTLVSVSCGRPHDIFAVARAFNRQYSPQLCFWIRFMATGLTGSSASGYIGAVTLRHDDMQSP